MPIFQSIFPDAYLPKYFPRCLSSKVFSQKPIFQSISLTPIFQSVLPDAHFPKYLILSSKLLKNAFVNSEWYQQYARAGPQLLTIQHHMVMWSVDTLPQLFEVVTKSFPSSSGPNKVVLAVLPSGTNSINNNYKQTHSLRRFSRCFN